MADPLLQTKLYIPPPRPDLVPRALMDAAMVNRFLNKGFQGLLAGLKHHAETGEEVRSGKGLEFAAVPA